MDPDPRKCENVAPLVTSAETCLNHVWLPEALDGECIVQKFGPMEVAQELHGSEFNGSTLQIQAGKPKRCAIPVYSLSTFVQRLPPEMYACQECSCQRHAVGFDFRCG